MKMTPYPEWDPERDGAGAGDEFDAAGNPLANPQESLDSALGADESGVMSPNGLTPVGSMPDDLTSGGSMPDACTSDASADDAAAPGEPAADFSQTSPVLPYSVSQENSLDDTAPLGEDGFPLQSADAGSGDATQLLGEEGAMRSLKEQREAKKRKKRIKRIVISAVAAAIVAIIVWRVVTTPTEDASTSAIATATVERGDFESKVTASGALEPVKSSNVTPEVDGIIDTVNVAEGDTVNQGDVLFTLTNSSLDKAVQDADQQVKVAKNGVDAAQVSVDGAYAAYNSAYNTYVAQLSQGLDATFDEASLDSAIDSAKISLDGANITLQSAQETYDTAVANAAKRTVTAPMTGSIIAMNAVPGTSVSSGMSSGASTSGSSSPLMQIADISKMTVTVQVNEIDINKISLGQTAKITFSAVPDLTLEGAVENIATSSTTSSATGASSGGITTYAVKILIDAPDQRLKPGMTANASILAQSLSDVLMVPATAIQKDEDGNSYVLVMSSEESGSESSTAEDGGYEQRSVTVKAQNSTTAVVEGDISEGDTVVISTSDAGESTDSVVAM